MVKNTPQFYDSILFVIYACVSISNKEMMLMIMKVDNIDTVSYGNGFLSSPHALKTKTT